MARTGRPRGSGATTIRVQAPPPGHSGQLFIGRRLWQDLGEPRRVRIERWEGRLDILPCGAGGYAVSGARGNGMPRVSIGSPSLFPLDLTTGVYAARVAGGRITIDGREETV